MLHLSRTVVIAFVATVTIAFLAACNTTSTTATPGQKKAAKDEYVVIEPEVGSRIKKRVKKSELKNYVGTAPTKREIITEDTDTVQQPTLTGTVERAVSGP